MLLQLVAEHRGRRKRAAADEREEMSRLAKLRLANQRMNQRLVERAVAAGISTQVEYERIDVMHPHEGHQPVDERRERLVLLVSDLVDDGVDDSVAIGESELASV